MPFALQPPDVVDWCRPKQQAKYETINQRSWCALIILLKTRIIASFSSNLFAV